MSVTVGIGDYQYRHIDAWGKDWPVSGVASDVATDSKGWVYVAVRTSQTEELNTGVILVFDSDGNCQGQWGEDHFATPHGLWISKDDEIFHADSANHTVMKFSLNGELLMTLGTRDRLGPLGGPFRSPTRAVQSGSGEIFVSDGYWQNRVHKFTSGGEHILSWGGGEPVFKEEAWNLYKQEMGGKATGIPGSGRGEFNLPHDVTVDSENRVYVMDRENNRCQVFDAQGEYLEEWQDVRGPNDAVIDRDGIMHIAEGVGSILITNLSGERIGRWGEKGDGQGNFAGFPHGIWIDESQDVYVAQVGSGHALQKFERL